MSSTAKEYQQTMIVALAGLALLVGAVNAQSSAYGQCGGNGWSGACVTGYSCTTLNPYYSQCLPGAAPSSSSAPVKTTVAPTTTVATTASTVLATSTSSGASAAGTQIRADQDPVFHFYLQVQDGAPVLGPEASAGNFVISGGTISTTSSGDTLYMNVAEGASTSYKPLTLNATATTTDWGLEGDTIITTAPRQLNFLTCPTSDSAVWSLFLQEGSDSPSSACANFMTLHLPCLC